jgi:chromosome segregation ATPase
MRILYEQKYDLLKKLRENYRGKLDNINGELKSARMNEGTYNKNIIMTKKRLNEFNKRLNVVREKKDDAIYNNRTDTIDALNIDLDKNESYLTQTRSEINELEVVRKTLQDKLDKIEADLKEVMDLISDYKNRSQNRNIIKLTKDEGNITGITGIEDTLLQNTANDAIKLVNNTKTNANNDELEDNITQFDTLISDVDKYIKDRSMNDPIQSGGEESADMNSTLNSNKSMSGGATDDFEDSLPKKIKDTSYEKNENKERVLRTLQQLDDELMDKNDYKALTSASVAFAVLLVSIYMSYTILNNTVQYKSQLFNGKLFGMSMCVN